MDKIWIFLESECIFLFFCELIIDKPIKCQAYAQIETIKTHIHIMHI